jgi:hypothetical protein
VYPGARPVSIVLHGHLNSEELPGAKPQHKQKQQLAITNTITRPENETPAGQRVLIDAEGLFRKAP